MTIAMNEHIRPEVPPTEMEQHAKTRLRGAAFRARKVHPGAVGLLVERELLAVAEFGYRMANGSLPLAVADEIMAAPLPTIDVPAPRRG